MFGDGFFASYPVFPRLLDDSLWQSRIEGDLEDQMMDFLEPWADRDLLLGPRAWVRPRPRWCPYTCTANRSRRPTRRHIVILPRLASDDDATPRSGRQCGRGAPAESSKTKGKENTTDNNLPGRKQASCTCSDRNEHANSRKRQTSGSSVSSEGCSSGALDNSGARNSISSTSSTDAVDARRESPWQFSADMSGCDEVRAVTEGGMLMVEGRGSSDSSHRMMRYITSLPRHVSHDSLTARLSNGRLTVTEKPGTQQLEGQARPLHIEVQQKQERESEAKEHKELQETSESTEQKQQKVPEPTVQQRAAKGNKQQKSHGGDTKQTPNLPTRVEGEQLRHTTAA